MVEIESRKARSKRLNATATVYIFFGIITLSGAGFCAWMIGEGDHGEIEAFLWMTTFWLSGIGLSVLRIAVHYDIAQRELQYRLQTEDVT